MLVSVIRTILAVLLVSYYAHAAGMPDRPDCDIDRGPCTKRIDNIEIALDINPKPVKAMKELSFTVNLRGSSGHEKLIIDLDMPGMYMGENRVLLKRSDDGEFTGIGVIPRCPGGKRLWRATIEIPDIGKVDFLFNVKK
jgi:hypothetical protein